VRPDQIKNNGPGKSQVRCFLQQNLRRYIRDNQLRLIAGGIPTIETGIVGNKIIIIIQLEAQADLGDASTRSRIIEVREGCAAQIDAIQIKVLRQEIRDDQLRL
jgi:hypothetical protein